MLLGDKPIGRGVPVDRLDRACRALKQCHKCVHSFPSEQTQMLQWASEVIELG